MRANSNIIAINKYKMEVKADNIRYTPQTLSILKT